MKWVRAPGVVLLSLALLLGSVAPRCQRCLADVTWQIQTVDSSDCAGRGTSLVFDSSDNPCLSYWADWLYTETSLKYAQRSGNSWSIMTVDSGRHQPGCYTSLAIDSSGRPSISYTDAYDGSLRFASPIGSIWGIQVVDVAAQMSGTSLVFNKSDEPCIAYGSRYAHFSQYAWHIATFDNSSGFYPSLGLDNNGNPAISYRYCKNPDYYVKYAAFDGSSWTTTTIDSVGPSYETTSLALDNAGNPCVSYHDSTSGSLKYAYWDGEGWTKQTVDSGGVGSYPSLAFDPAGFPAISYCGHSNGSLKYARYSGSAWEVRTVDSGGFGGDEGYTSLSFDSRGNPGIGYYDRTNSNLKYAYLPLNDLPSQPKNVAPSSGATDVGITPTLTCSSFSDPDTSNTHTASQWQVRTSTSNYDDPIYDSGITTSELTTVSIPSGKLGYDTIYCWHVRHRDNHGAWSDWSEETSFTTVANLPPASPVVTDDGNYTISTTELHATWSSSDAGAGISEYQYAIGTSSGATDVLGWTSAGTNTEVTHTGLSLTAGTAYYFAVKARNGAGSWSDVGVSDGIAAKAGGDGNGDGVGNTPSSTSDGGGLPSWIWIVIGVGAVLVVSAAAYFVGRRQGTQ